mgnify:CR=1 FL=1
MHRLLTRTIERILGTSSEDLVTLISETIEHSLPKDYHWPGNVRELENLLTQALVQARGNALTPDLLPLRPSASASSLPAVETAAQAAKSLDQVEAEHIQLVLDATSGHKGKSCEILGISRPALDRKIKKFALSLTKNR